MHAADVARIRTELRQNVSNCNVRAHKLTRTHLHRLRALRSHVPDVEAPVPVPSAGDVAPAGRDAGVHETAERFFLVLALPLHAPRGVYHGRGLPRVHAVAKRAEGERGSS